MRCLPVRLATMAASVHQHPWFYKPGTVHFGGADGHLRMSTSL